MKIRLAQIDTTVGDFEGNSAIVIAAISDARADGCDLVVFPELALTGYPPLDLLDRPSFLESAVATLDRVVAASDGISVLVGCILPNDGAGKALFNAAVLVRDGRIIGVHRKVLLPTYDVFDEARHFEPGPAAEVLDPDGLRIAVTVCEDVWNVAPAAGRNARYRRDPVGELAEASPRLFVNLSASPFAVGKRDARFAIAREVSARCGCPFLYCNLVGGNDGLVFDGESFAMDAGGHFIGIAHAFAPDHLTVDTVAPTGAEIEPAERSEARSILEALCLGIRDFCGKLRIRKVAIGLSGGIDSAVTAALAARALGPSAVIGVGMPSRYTSPESRRDSRELAENLGIVWHEVAIDDVFDAHSRAAEGLFGGRPGGLTEENLQARIRGAILMSVSNSVGALVLNTGNKSELATGYCTLYGDMVGGLAVLGDLTKDRVYAVARELNRGATLIPQYTIDRAPSAELRPDQKDEDSLPPYPVLDRIVRGFIEEDREVHDLIAEGLDETVVRRVIGMLAASEFKRRQAPPAIRVTSKAFGIGRRLPIVQRFG